MFDELNQRTIATALGVSRQYINYLITKKGYTKKQCVYKLVKKYGLDVTDLDKCVIKSGYIKGYKLPNDMKIVDVFRTKRSHKYLVEGAYKDKSWLVPLDVLEVHSVIRDYVKILGEHNSKLRNVVKGSD